LHIQNYPRKVGVRLHRLDDQVPRDAVEELPDVEIDHPVGFPATSSADLDRVQRGALRPIAIGVWVEDRLDLPLQYLSHHRLSDPVAHSRHPQNPGATAMSLGDLHRLHRGREVRARGHPVPDLVQVSLEILLELLDRHSVDARCPFVGLDLLVCLPDSPF
jgi:hypothetical protein